MPLSNTELHSRCKELIDGADQLVSQARRLIRWRATVQSIAAMGATVLAVALFDIWLRREEQGLRLLASAIVLAVAVLVYFRILRPAWRFGATRAQVAAWANRTSAAPPNLVETIQLAEAYKREVEPGSPQLHGTEASTHGSPGFLRAALQQWFEQYEAPAWHRFLDTGSWWRQVAVLATVGLGIAVASFAAPSVMRQAIARLTNPLFSSPWPLADDLRLLRPPAVISFGETVQLEIIDSRPPLPETVDVLVRSASPAESPGQPIQRIPATQIGDMAIANLRPLTHAVEVSAVGGEHTSGRWHRIDVIRPPALEDYRFEISPPEYTKLPPESVSGRRIGVIAGSRVRLTGKFATKLAGLSARFQFGALALQSSQNADDWQSQWTSTLDTNGTDFTVGTANSQPAEVLSNMRWQFELTSRDGLNVRLQDAWEIDAKPDQPPSVSIQPSRLSSVTASGEVQISGEASDDFGVAKLELVIASGEKEYRQMIVEHTDPAEYKSFPFVHTFAIAEVLGAEQPAGGPALKVFIDATDAIGQTARATYQELTVGEPAAVLAELAAEQTAIAQQLSDIVRLQNENSSRLDRASTQIDSTDALEQSDAIELESVARTQAEVLRQLEDPAVGIARRIEDSLNSLERNGLTNQPGMADSLNQQLTDMNDSVRSLANSTAMKAADSTSQLSTTAARNVAENRAADRQLERQIELAQQASGELLQGLEQLEERVAASQARRQLASDLRDVLDQQKSLRRETDDVQINSLDRDQIELYQERLRDLSLDQTALADILQSLVDRASRLASHPANGISLDASQQQEAQEIGRVAEKIREATIPTAMRQASNQLRSENFADAAIGQSAVIESLEQALGSAGTGTHSIAAELELLADEARDQTRQLRALAGEQQKLSEELARTNSDQASRQQLADAQTSLQQQTDALEQLASSAGRGALADQLTRTSQLQRQAARQALDDDPTSASSTAQNAAEQLQRSADWLEDRANTLAEQVRRQQSLGLQEQLQALAAEQAKIVKSIRATEGRSDLSQVAIELTQMLVEQQQSATRTRQTIDRLPTFVWALEHVDRSLSRAVAAAERQRLLPEADNAASEALRWLEQAAVAVESIENEVADSPSEEAGEQQDDSSASQPQPSLASIKLLRALQADVRRETLRVQGNPASAQQSRDLASLAAQQEALGQQLGKLLETPQQ